jgi:acetyl esterase/lipase
MIELERMDPEVRPKVSRLRAVNLGNPVMRLLFAALPYTMPSHRVPGVALTTDRAGSVPVRIYRPEKASGAGLLWIHGGGLVGGVAKMDDRFCGETAQQLGVTIVSVEYRLAPKFPFPAGLDDVHAAFTWFLDHAESWGVDRERIVVGGQSAGGGLAAALVQRLYDEGRHVAAQWLWCPMLDDRTALNSDLDAIGHLVWDNRANRYGWGSYLQGLDRSALPPYASPSHREDLSGLPPAWLYASDIELFHDEVVEYARRLREAGVDTTLDIVHGVPHGVEATLRDIHAAQSILAQGRTWLGECLGSSAAPS